MRQIKASEVKPGMTIRWGRWDISYQCTLTRVERFNGGPGVQGETRQGKTVFLRGDDDVLVVKEPAQPEEPTEFGARVVVAGERALRIAQGSWLTDGLERCTWDDLCEMGPVTIIDANPSWTAPADREPTPEVPKRIEEWDTWEDVPEGVAVTTSGLFCHYRKNQGVAEFSDPDNDPDWTELGFFRTMPREYGPWTRDTDDTHEVPDRIEKWPENDTALRKHKWRDRDGDLWTWRTTASRWDCHALTDGYLFSSCCPTCAPWTRATEEPTPVVPERIEEWPEDDTALRPYPWRDRDGGTWKWSTTDSAWECYDEVGYYLQSGGRPFYGPWDRVTDA